MATAAIVTDDSDIVFAVVDDNGLVPGCLWYFQDVEAVQRLGVIIQEQSWGQLVGSTVFKDMPEYDDAYKFVSEGLKGPQECDAVAILGEEEGMFTTTAACIADDGAAFESFLDLIFLALGAAASAKTGTSGKPEKKTQKASVKDMLRREFGLRKTKFTSSDNDPNTIMVVNGLAFTATDKLDIIWFGASLGTSVTGSLVILQQPQDPPSQVVQGVSSTLSWCVNDFFGNCNNGGVVAVQVADGYLAVMSFWDEENDEAGYSAWYNIGPMSNIPSDMIGWETLIDDSPNTVRPGSVEPYIFPKELGYLIQAKPIRGSGDTYQVTITISALPATAEVK